MLLFFPSLFNLRLQQDIKVDELKQEQDVETEVDLNEKYSNFLDEKKDFAELLKNYSMTPEEKVKEQNRIRQLAFKIRPKMPKDYKSYCLVAAHLLKNAHRYQNCDDPDIKMELSFSFDNTDQKKYRKSEGSCENEKEDTVKLVNKKLREIRTLKHHNRIREQQVMVSETKEKFGSYRDISGLSGIPLKTVHDWCSVPKERKHRATQRSQLRKDEFLNFLMQDTITYSHPCKRYAGKRFLLDTWDEIYKKYLQQPRYHTNGVISKSSMRSYRPKYVLLSGSTPINQCLCDYCENCELIMKGLVAAGIKGIPPNKYLAIDATLCDARSGQFGTGYEFCGHSCITRQCNDCGKDKLKVRIEEINADLLKLNRTITWHQWKSIEGKSAPQKCEIKKPLRTAVNQFLEIIDNISDHLFRASWHKHIFEYIKNNMSPGYVLQVMDFAMNFNNRYQDEVQSAYWNGTQTTIHGTVNFYLCPRQGCSEIVTLALVHISDDMKHDSFLSRAAQNLTFKYLVALGIPLELIIQFCDNCAAQYKSRHPFAELARIALEIIRIYFGEKHGKSHADALFGRLKAWMSYKIKARHFVVSNAHDFFKYCREYYQTPVLQGCCQHYRVEFEFIRPSDVRRHQDCDLDEAVEGTQSIYSVRNTAEPLQLKVRHVPCLCPPCIKDDGSECLNSDHTDPWKLVKLVPERGANIRKYQKRQRPDKKTNEDQQVNPGLMNEDTPILINGSDADSDGEIPDMQITLDLLKKQQERRRQTKNKKKQATCESNRKNVTEDTVTDDREPRPSCSWINVAEEITAEDFQSSDSNSPLQGDDVEIIDVCEKMSKEFRLAGENAMCKKRKKIPVTDITDEIPEDTYWASILLALENCKDELEFNQMALELKNRIPVLKPRITAQFRRNVDVIDDVAKKEIPLDGPIHLIPVKTYGDGNCLCRAISKAYFDDDSHHLEMRARIVIEGIINKKHYISDDCLERGATYIHSNADLPTVFTSFSEYYTPGQRVTDETISYIYSKEIQSCSHPSSYMGLWQLAQISSVLGIPVHTIYPHRESSLRNDFHRIFFPIHYPPTGDDDPLVIMWTGIRRGGVPIHFVPLLKPENNE